MKKIIAVALSALAFIACGKDQNTDAETSPLVLNSECISTQADSALLYAIAEQDLEALKSALGHCATTSIAAYSDILDSLPSSILATEGLVGTQGNDSLIIYLLENGADSAGRNWDTHTLQRQGLLVDAMSAGQYDLVHYLLDHGYYVDPAAVWYAIRYNQKGLYDTLVKNIEVDSIHEWDVAALAKICNEIDQAPHIEPYFYDLLAKGANPDNALLNSLYTPCSDNPTIAVSPTPLAYCLNSSSESAARRRLVQALLNAGANPHKRFCTLKGDLIQDASEWAKEYGSPLLTLLDSAFATPAK